jgi:hypothetical protein
MFERLGTDIDPLVRVCCMSCEEGKTDRRSVTLLVSGRQSFGGDFGIVFRADRPGRVYMRNDEQSLQRIMTHEPIQTIKTLSPRCWEEKKDGKGDWVATCEDGTLMYPDSSWPRQERSNWPAFAKYATVDGREPPSFGPAIPTPDDMAQKIRLAIADGELSPDDVTHFITTITLLSSTSSSTSSLASH